MSDSSLSSCDYLVVENIDTLWLLNYRIGLQNKKSRINKTKDFCLPTLVSMNLLAHDIKILNGKGNGLLLLHQ